MHPFSKLHDYVDKTFHVAWPVREYIVQMHKATFRSCFSLAIFSNSPRQKAVCL